MSSLHEVSLDQLNAIIDIARFAPSVHNTQPWRVSYRSNVIQIKLDPQYVLEDGDPTKRQSLISLGIFVEAINIAAGSLGYITSDSLSSKSSAEVKLTGKTSKYTKEYSELVSCLHKRATDRSIYRHVKLSVGQIRSITNSYKSNRIKIYLKDNKEFVSKIADLTSRGIALAISNPSFRSELSRYLTRPGSKYKRGISVNSLYIPWFVAYLEPWFMRLGIGLKREATLEKKRWESSSGIVIITAKGDLHDYWYEAGKAYLRTSLEIEHQGLSQATSAAIVEASNYHEDIEQMIGTNDRILAIMRIGIGSKKRNYSPRVNTDEIIIRN